MAYVAVSSGSLCNYGNRNFAVGENAITCAVSFAFAQREFIPMTAGAACESGLDQFGQLSIPQGVTNPSFASNPHIF
jgi:hypothetical protein